MSVINLNDINLVNWNANGIKSKKSSLMEFLTRHKIDIACITETHLKNHETFKLNGYNIYRKDRNHIHSSGGVAILIKKNIKHYQSITPNMISLEAISITISTNKHQIKIISAYNPPNKKIQKEDISKIFDNHPTILLGDLNSKNQIWGCLKTNLNGIKLLQITTKLRILISPPSKPTFQRSGRVPDILDIALISNLPTTFHHQVINELDSDHVPVITTLNEPLIMNQSIPKLITAPINWKTFRDKLNTNLSCTRQYKNPEDINTSIEYLTNTIKKSINQAMIKNNKTINHPPADSLPTSIQNLLKQKHKARRIWQNTRNPAVKRRLNQLTRRVKWELDNLRYNSYSAYLKKINPNDSSLWLATKRLLKQQNVIPPLKNGLAKFETNAEKTEVLANHFASCFTPIEEDAVFNDQNITNPDINHLLANEINDDSNGSISPTSPTEIQQILVKLANKKSPGHDLITNKILKNVTPKVLSYLASLYNSAMRFGTFPSSWKHAIIIPIHKPGKLAHLPSSYRPISLLPSLSKLYERILLNRLKSFTQIIPKHQFGFKTHHSTCHQIQRISEIIVSGFENKLYTTAVFLDVTQAFDKVWHNGLEQKLNSLALPKYLLKTIMSFISDRTFQVRIGTQLSQPQKIQAGVPQGSVLGPSLFNIYCHDIPTPPNSQLAMFADDTTILTQSNSLESSIQNLQTALNTVTSWFKTWKLNLNPTKSAAKIFSLKHYKDPQLVYIDNQPIQWNKKDDSVKYLGVFLDEKLTWKIHINKKLTQGYTRMNTLYPLVNSKSTLQMKSSILLYTSIIRPLVTYACPTWAAASSTKIKKIQILQNKFLRICLKAPWFMRNKQIHNDTGTPLLQDWIKIQFKNFHANLKTSDGARFYNLGTKTKNRRPKPTKHTQHTENIKPLH